MKKVADLLKADLLLWNDEIDFGKYDVLIFRAPAGVVVRKLCGKLKSKFEDPAIVVLDPSLSYAIPLLGGHEGANEIAKRLELLGMKAVITTSAEFEEGYSIGVGFRKNSSSQEIVEAINEAINLLKISLKDVKIVATAMIKKKDSEFRKAVEYLGLPAGFVSEETINSMNVRETSAVKIGLKNVAEACALYYSKNKELILPKKVFGGVTIAVAR
ncbi:MAG: cobalamin biosynthesis protein [Archaeoglobaceae archaeon]|nr:cobalamin biosynthesis protein [Archaeoglobales archaeon]